MNEQEETGRGAPTSQTARSRGKAGEGCPEPGAAAGCPAVSPGQLRRRNACKAEKQAQARHRAGKVAHRSCCGTTKAIPFILLWSSTMQKPSSKRAAGSAPMHGAGCTLQIIPWRKAEKGQLTPHRGAVGCCNVTQELQGSLEQPVVW